MRFPVQRRNSYAAVQKDLLTGRFRMAQFTSGNIARSLERSRSLPLFFWAGVGNASEAEPPLLAVQGKRPILHN
jgi:hypothetical protein